MSSVPHAFTQPLSWHYLCGPVRLSVQADDFAPAEPTPCAAEAAVVLDLAGELLDALDAAGLATHGPWHWVATSGGAAGAVASWRGAQAEVRLTLPWPALRALQAAPVLPGLQWQPVLAECLLAQWQLSEDERAALEPGGLLLLDGPARPQLRARSEPLTGEAGPCTGLVARWEQPLPLEVVMGWQGTAPALPPRCLLIDTARPEPALAHGHLVPWGSGQAFRAEAL